MKLLVVDLCHLFSLNLFESLSPHGPQSSPQASSKSLISHSACSVAWQKMHDATPKSASSLASDLVCDANSSIVWNVPEFSTEPTSGGVSLDLFDAGSSVFSSSLDNQRKALF